MKTRRDDVGRGEGDSPRGNGDAAETGAGTARRDGEALHAATVPSPLGPIRILATPDALVGVRLPGSRKWEEDRWRSVTEAAVPLEAADLEGGRHPVLREAARELRAYFAGDLRDFSTPLALSDPPFEGTPFQGTPFQRKVWRGLLSIPYGERRSYAWLAEEIEKPGAYQAVGAANGRNPLPIVVPCHRVVGADGGLVGYGGGLEAKRWLLDHEADQRDLFSSSRDRG